MKIKDNVYETLTPDQRIQATLDALGRGDIQEADRLADTCPEYSYRMKDAAYIMRLHIIIDLHMAVENDMRGVALIVLILVIDRQKTGFDLAPFIQQIVNIKTAWDQVLKEIGLSYDILEKALNMQHPCIEMFLSMAILPHPDNEKMVLYRKKYREIIDMYA